MTQQRTGMDPALDAFTRRRQQRNHERNNPPEMPDLFAPPADDPPEVAPQPSPDEKYAAWLEGAKRQLAELAREMLRDAGEEGVTFDDVRIAAETRGILTGNEEGRTLSFGAALMKSLGAIPCEYKPSRHRNSNGRVVRVWKLAAFASPRST